MQDLVVREGVSRREISGTPVYCGSPVDWVARIDAAVSRHTVCLGYVNTHTAYLLATDDDYRAACRDLTLLNDGVGLDIVSLIKYDRAFEFNLNGSDFTPYFLKTSRHRFRVFMLGGRPGVAARAAEACRRMAPQHKYVGSHRGHLTPQEDLEVVRLINAARANLVIVGFGNPHQEVWMSTYARQLDADVIIGVGALLDFMAGAVPRAPRWMQRAKLEWLYRLALEPRRLWKRYMVFTPALIGQAVMERLKKSGWVHLAIVAAVLCFNLPMEDAYRA